MDKLLSGLSDAPNIEFPQFLVLIVIVLISGAFKNVFMCMFNCIAVAIKYVFMYTFKAIAVILEFLYAVLTLVFNFILRLKDKLSLTPFAVHWSSDSSQEADRKTMNELFAGRKAQLKSEKSDKALEESQ